MALFATMSIYYLSEALFKKEKVIVNLFIAGICVFLSSLTKGLQGLFPITAVFFFWMVSKQLPFKKNIIYSIILVGTPVLIYALLIATNSHIYDVFKLYFENRLGKAFNSTVHNTTDNRFEIMIRLFTELIPMFILMLIIYLFQRKSKQEVNEQKNKRTKIYWLLLIGFSGSLPLISTLEQRGFYLLTSLPLFAIAGAIAVSGRMKQLIEKINTEGTIFKYSKWTTIVVFIFSMVFTLSKIGESKRDKELLVDIHAFGKIIPRGEIVSIPMDMWNDWNLQTYSVRYNYISLDGISGEKHRYLFIRKNLPKTLVPESYELYPIQTQYIDLYVLKNKKQ
jgi:4-amino-4-deoxy-L-arabinose transferase-like glycosyltransferase